jgi:hypothetical protein
MARSTLNPSKKSRGRPPVDSEQVNLRVHRWELDGLDAFIAEQPEPISRTEALRRILRDWLIGHGYLEAG